MPLSVGTRLGPYEIVAPLGKGGMGEVYRARDTRLRRDVAIKVVQRGHSDPSLWDRFEREARAASALNHPNICSVFDTGEADGLPYLVMELLEGQTLRELIGTRPVESGAAVGIALQIADALEAAHAKGILHRDIKPGNVMIVGRSHVKVLDFGLAKQTAIGESNETATLGMETETGSVVGTPAYLAPEVLQGAKADARSDLWALGVVLYQMLSGELPFKGATTFEISSAILKEEPAPLPPSVPLRLRAVVERCLEKRPEKRYQAAGEIRISLEALPTGAKAAAPNRRLLLWAVGAVVLVAIAGAFVWERQAAGKVRTGSTGAPLSVNQEANDLFEVGINAQMVQNDIPRAQEMYERALALDPHFAEALRFRALNYVILLLNGYTNDTNLLYKAEVDLRQVAQENPNSINLPASQAAVYMTQGRRDLVPLERLERLGREYPLQGRAHHLINDPAHKSYFGYDIALEPAADGNSAQIRIEPLRPGRADISRPSGWILLQLPKYPVIPSVKVGDTVALDLLVNAATGQKIVDYLTLERRGSPKGRESHDFTLADVAMTLSQPQIWVNGKLEGTYKYPGGTSGSVVWFYLGGHGRFNLSLFPSQKYGFKKNGVVSENTATLRDGTTEYRVESSGPIAPGFGVYNLYVWHEPEFPGMGEPFSIGSEDAGSHLVVENN